MAKRHLIIDRTTGEMTFRGRDGRDHSAAEVAAAERAARGGDPAARALLESLELPTDVDRKALARQLVHDCPECRAAMAMGDRPMTVMGPEDLAVFRAQFERDNPELCRELAGELRPSSVRSRLARRPRWRDLKRGIRR